jgi:hypothetical protein
MARRPRRLRKLKLLVVLAVVCAVVRFVAPAFGWPPVRGVEVLGCVHTDELSVVRAASISPDASAWSLDEGLIRERVAELPSVADAEVSISMTGAVSIEVREHEPVAYLGGGPLRVVSARGEVFPVSGTRDWTSLPVVFGATVVSGRLAESQSYVAVWCDSLRAEPELWSRLSEVRVRRDGSELVFSGGPTAVVQGSPWPRSIEALSRVVSSLPNGGTGGVLDCRFVDQIVVRGL